MAPLVSLDWLNMRWVACYTNHMNLAVMIAVLLDPVAILLLAIGGVSLGKTRSPASLCIVVALGIAMIMEMLLGALSGPFRARSAFVERLVVYSLALLVIRWITMRIAGSRAAKGE
jgi:hypothetical protein